MFVHRLVCAASVIAVAHAAIRFDEFNINIMGDGSETYERQIKQSLETTKNFFARDDVKLIATAAGKVMGYVPFVNQFSAVIPGIQSALASETDFKENLAKAIPDASQRSTAETALVDIRSQLRSVAQVHRFLKYQDEFTVQSTTAMIHDIHTALDTSVNKFADKESVFRKYPLIAMNVLFALATAVANFVPVQLALVPGLKRSRITCDLEATLLEYRQLAAESRLTKTKIYTNVNDIPNNRMVRNVMGRSFNEYGYNQTNWGTVQCDRGCKDGYVCLEDLITGEKFDADVKAFMDGCIVGYMELLRHRVEEAFEDPIYLMHRTCLDEIRNRPLPQPTGDGWWEITFHDGFATYDADGHYCDIDGQGSCDPYVKLLVNGKEVFKSATKWNSHNPFYGETYKSKKMKKDASTTIEVWDDDSGFLGSSDDLVLRWNTNINDLLKNGRKTGWVGSMDLSVGSIVTTSAWKDEYPLD